jgi:hypothetical protein
VFEEKPLLEQDLLIIIFTSLQHVILGELL